MNLRGDTHIDGTCKLTISFGKIKSWRFKEGVNGDGARVPNDLPNEVPNRVLGGFGTI